MRVLMLSWEYPPLVVGGLGRHVGALAPTLAAAGHDVVVVTRGTGEPVDERGADGVRVVRAAPDPLAIDFTTETLLAWSQAAEHSLVRTSLPVLREWRPDVVHAHDWLVAQTAATVTEVTGAPLVATVHATEAGRHQGWLPAPLNRAIDSAERWLVARADHVIACSAAMRDEVVRGLDADAATLSVIPNGIDAAAWRTTGRARERARRAHGGAPLLVFAGRLVHEKGVQTALAALAELRAAHPAARLVVAGTGPYQDELRAEARRLGVARAVEWVGFVPDAELAALLGAADAVVVPSLYEPFGLVALEAVAAGAPVVLAAAGGLRDLVDARLAAGAFEPGDPGGLHVALDKVLADAAGARRAAGRARRAVGRDFGWGVVAARTAEVYQTVRAR